MYRTSAGVGQWQRELLTFHGQRRSCRYKANWVVAHIPSCECGKHLDVSRAATLSIHGSLGYDQRLEISHAIAGDGSFLALHDTAWWHMGRNPFLERAF
jgi:hypothetical protein